MKALPDELIGITEVSRVCASPRGPVHRGTIYRWIKTREFPGPSGIDAGRALWSRAAVLAWLEGKNQ